MKLLAPVLMVLVLSVLIWGQKNVARAIPARALPPLFVLASRAQPTHQALLARLRRLLPRTPVEVLSGSGLGGFQDELVRRDALGRGILVVFGAALAVRVPDRPGLPLLSVSCGLLPPQRPALLRRRERRLHISPEAARVGQALRRFLPKARRLGVLGSSPAPHLLGPGRVSLALSLGPGSRVRDQVQLWASQVDVLLVPDREPPPRQAEAILREARRQGLPCATTAPWLSHSGVALAVLTDAPLLGLRLVAELRSLASGGTQTADGVPAQVMLDLAAPPFAQHPPAEQLLLAADILRRGER